MYWNSMWNVNVEMNKKRIKRNICFSHLFSYKMWSKMSKISGSVEFLFTQNKNENRRQVKWNFYIKKLFVFSSNIFLSLNFFWYFFGCVTKYIKKRFRKRIILFVTHTFLYTFGNFEEVHDDVGWWQPLWIWWCSSSSSL